MSAPDPTRGLGDRVLYGAAYYHEYQPYKRLDTDLDLMAAAHLSVIRVGESVWSTWEPADGVFDLDWLQPVLDGAHRRGIAAILGTPTYAIPAWLHRKHPELMAQRRSGEPIPYGHRQNVDYSQPAFRDYAGRVVRRIVDRYADHPAVIGYQIDNEPGAELFANPATFEGFRDHLRRRYGDVEELNRRWGLTYWSHRLGGWEDLWAPDGNTTPGYDLEWRRYQAGLTTDFLAWQADLVRLRARDDQFITTCLAYGRPGTHEAAVGPVLDVVAVNPYYAMQDAFTMPQAPAAATAPAPAWSRGTGLWWLSFEADLARGLKDGPFLVTETNASSIGEPHVNYPAYDGQWRQAAWVFVARGARMVEYWHWHTLHYGNEMYWGGILGHSLTPGRAYAEIARTGGEFARAGAAIAPLVPDVDVAVLRSEESRWAFQFNPPLAREGSRVSDPESYDRVFGATYRGFFDTGRQVAVVGPADLGTAPADDGPLGPLGPVDPVGPADATAPAALAFPVEDLVRRWPVLVVPVLYVASDALLDRLAAYAAAGGHLVLGFRSGYVDPDVQARHEVMPGRLREAVGAHYLEYTNLARAVPLADAAGSGPGGLDLPAGTTATAWADGLVLDTATALATYGDRHLGRWPAITTHAHGAGRVTYLGTLPDAGGMAALARWLVPTPANAAWAGRPPSVTVTGATNAAGDHLSFVANWSWDPAEVTLPAGVEDLLADGAAPAPDTGPDTGTVTLAAWDVRVFRRPGGGTPTG